MTIQYFTPTAKMSLKSAHERVARIYRDAEELGHPHTTILAAMQKIHAELASVTATGATRYLAVFKASVSGYESALFDRVQRDCLEFVYRDAEGNTYSTHRLSKHHKSTDVYFDSGRGSELADLECSHCWKSNGKPFGEWETPRAASERAAALAAVKADKRYTVLKEFTGRTEHAEWVVRFCGEWLGLQDSTEQGAYLLAVKHAADRHERITN